ncbi:MULTISPECIES: 50S ribosomal protein L9 [unclassified Pseudactinotalea]|uniref:50S ribosomal protein L9 n=1 Tax=unclassified Pseudactinotalea TaxID=2649176 RepID=UPI00128C952D|nr:MULTISPECIES: 50S ribosomal protein L9 [unclassified Pseudactinotalea]MPV50850.1 50S ribosomal protein L9 [Pseudactinotalea sp. HY160]QGH70810.1 50S ribosomal protein L9 [Pseudactinotalea sp. HY158]
MATKLILTHEVSGLGAPGDVVEVKDGYARNYLMPRGLATGWTKGAQKQIDQITAARRKREIATIEGAQAARDSLSRTRVIVPVRAGESGRLFGAVTTSDIATAVKAAGGPNVDKRKIEVKNPIKSLGEYQVSVRLHADVTATIDIQVVPGK